MRYKISPLILALDTPGDHKAEVAIQKIAKKGKSLLPQLLEVAQSSQEFRIQKWSLEALGAIGDKKALPVLLRALKDERMQIRLHALKGLGRMKNKSTAKIIAGLLKDKSGGIRVNALYVLVKLGDRSILPHIQRALHDEQWYVRQNACVACGVFGATRTKGILKKLATNDPKKAVQKAALVALEKIG